MWTRMFHKPSVFLASEVNNLTEYEFWNPRDRYIRDATALTRISHRLAHDDHDEGKNVSLGWAIYLELALIRSVTQERWFE